MIIKNYIQFINESINGHKYGCVMIEVPVSNWDEITSSIDPEDIFEQEGNGDPKGIQKNPHITLLYGLHDDVTLEQVKSVFENFDGDINIEVNGVGIFENDKFDVVKFNVNPQGSLQYLFEELSKLPNSNQFPKYEPHITIAYVKKGLGKKYKGLDIFEGKSYKFNNLVFSPSEGEDTIIYLTKNHKGDRIKQWMKKQNIF